MMEGNPVQARPTPAAADGQERGVFVRPVAQHRRRGLAMPVPCPQLSLAVGPPRAQQGVMHICAIALAELGSPNARIVSFK